ncbi:capsular polysaccharide synthesis protein [Rhizobium sp. ZW T2_16]|uniref:capsular polysaccharide synthesis protein n=1 Tax=Rhizobium sp. ZW T2_16 TaxID=3378083 RepID=UPI0038553566
MIAGSALVTGDEKSDPFGAEPQQIEAVFRFVDKQYPAAAKAASKRIDWIAKNRFGDLTPRFRIFVYWAQGFEQAPAVVQSCLRHLKALHAEADVALVTDANFRFFVDLPDTVRPEVFANKTFFSDLLRFELLSRYGGIWADATCLASKNWIPVAQRLIENSGFFAFPKGKDGVISSWFLASQPGNYVSCLIREMMIAYCSEHPGPDHYFALHQIFKLCFEKDAQFRSIVLSIDPGKSKPRQMNRLMLKSASGINFPEVYRSSFVHKLSWKHKPEQVTSKTLIAAVARGDWLNLTDFKAVSPPKEHQRVNPGEILINPTTGVKLRYNADLMTEHQAARVKAGRFESKEIQAASSVLKGGERILELGGGFGIVSATICKTKSPQSYNIIEANPSLVPAINDAHELNDLKVATVHNCIATSDAEAIERGFYDFNIGKSLLGSSIHNIGQTRTTVRVPAVPLQKFLDDLQPQVIIIDIEGAELGLFATVDMASVNVIIMETHPGIFGLSGMAQLFGELAAQGFAYETVGSHGPVVTFRRVTKHDS